jgi:hypothetical protein
MLMMALTARLPVFAAWAQWNKLWHRRNHRECAGLASDAAKEFK